MKRWVLVVHGGALNVGEKIRLEDSRYWLKIVSVGRETESGGIEHVVQAASWIQVARAFVDDQAWLWECRVRRWLAS